MTVLVIAPHPDDETLGAGGTLLRTIAEGERVVWMLVTKARTEDGFPASLVEKRDSIIDAVAAAYQFDRVVDLEFPASGLELVPQKDLIGAIGEVVGQEEAATVYIPSSGDAHSDHRIVAASAIGATKIFRKPLVKRILGMEIPSETNFGIDPLTAPFRPNHYVDIGKFLERKIEILGIYNDELAAPPFPRNLETIRAYARLRGDEAGCMAAEAYSLVKEIR